jgi:hypothetical protein
MATFTVTNSVNIDSLAGKTGGDVYNINGGHLTIDQDSRYGQNNATNATMLTINCSSTLGGNITIKGDKVRLIPYDTGTGNVPAYNTTISQGGASGLLIGVYSALNVAPTAPGSAMPASGFIKIKQWNDVAYTAGALTGIGANATDADRAGWIEVVGQESGTLTINRLNNTANKLAQGSWYEIGTTDGVRATTYQIPSNGVNQYHGGVWVETATPGQYEYYSTTTDNAVDTAVATSERKGKFCWISTAGLLRFGHDGTNSSGGYCPPAGRKIRIPNVFLQSATSGTPTQNSFNATIGVRFRLVTTAAGTVDVDKISAAWNFLNLTNCVQLSLTNSSFINRIGISNNANALTMTNVGIGQLQVEGNSILNISGSLEGGTLTDIWIGRGQWSGSNNFGIAFSNSSSYVCNNINIYGTSNRTGSHYPIYINNSSAIKVNGGALNGRIWVNIASDVEIKNVKWWESPFETNTQAGDNLLIVASTTNATFENINVADGDMPPGSVFSVSTLCKNIKIRNVGTYASPISTGLPSFDNASVSRSGTVATVTTSSPHQLRTNQYVFVWQTDMLGITFGPKQVTVTSATTFTFTCNNTGATSGYVNYKSVQQNNIATITNSQNVKLQNVHAYGSRNNIYIANNTNKDIYIENITDDNPYINVGLAGAANLRLDSVTDTPNSGTPQSAVYGSHFVSGFQFDLTAPKLVGTGVSWTRSGSTITVTNTNHKLTPNTYIQVLDSSNPAGTLSGRTRSITVVNNDTFTFTGANTGATSGTLDYRVADSKLTLQMNEPNASTAPLYTVNSGTPLFTGGGRWSALNSGDQATWTMERFIIGFTNIPQVLPSWDSGGSEYNYRLQYDIDRGSGFSGTFKNWFYPVTGGAVTSGSPTCTVASTTGIAVGDYVFGQGIPNGTKVQSIDNATTLTLNANANATISGQTLTFNYAPNETTFPTAGVKFKFRITVLNTITTTLAFVYIPLSSNATSRAALYPQDVETVTFSLTGLPTGTTVALYDSTNTELQRDDNITSGEFEYQYIHSGSDIEDVYYVVWHPDYIPYKSAPFDLTDTDLGLSFTPIDDTVYDASYVDRYTINYTNKRIIMNSGETVYDVRGAYSKWKDDIFLSDNFTYDFAFSVLGNVVYDPPKRVPPFTSLTNNWKIRPDEANHTLTVSGGILYVDGGGDPFVNTLGAYTVRIKYVQPVEVLMIATGSGVLPSDVSNIVDAVWSDSATYAVGEKGNILASEILSNTDATQAKVDQL